MAEILLIGADNEAVRDAVQAAVRRRGHELKHETAAEPGLAIHRAEGAEVVFLALPLPDAPSPDVLQRLRTQDPRAVVLVSGRDADIGHGAVALELGAYLYLADPTDHEELHAALGLALGAKRADAELRYLRGRDAAGSDWQSIVGQSEGMRQAFTTVRKICRRTMLGGSPTVLITGETGTGKGLFAKALHYNGVRRSRAMVELNCAAVPASLMEAELFGHERGAFTDARAARAGLLETAHLGTLFLDEIGALPLELQGKLHNVVEEKSVRRLGSSASRPVDVQLVAATSRDLEAMVEAGEFAADLYHRLNVVRIHLPPLRDRGDDKLLLADTFLEALCREYGLPPKRLSDSARNAVDRYPWPGNVRELRNRIERIVLLADDEQIGEAQLGLEPDNGRARIRRSGAELEIELPPGGLPLAELERAAIRRALEVTGGNVTHAAHLLDVSRHTLLYRMKKHGL